MGHEAVAVIGRNGMGKTTLCNALMGLTADRRAARSPFAGERLGQPSYRIAAPRDRLRPAGPPAVPVAHDDEHLRMFGGRRGGQLDAIGRLRAVSSARRAQQDRREPLSGGEQQMLAIGRALLTHPAAIMDEPSEGLAPTIVDDLIASCTSSSARAWRLLVEQNLGVATEVAERQLVMVAGRIAAETTATALIADPKRSVGTSGSSRLRRDRVTTDDRVPASLLRVADPEHDDQEPRRLPADLPHLGLRPVERPLHRAGDSLLRGARERRRRADHHRRDTRPRELADGAAADAAAMGRPQHRAARRRSRTRCTKPAASSRSSSGTRACAASRSTSRRRNSTSTRPWYTLSPSQVPLGEFPGASTPKELSEDEIEEILDAYAASAARAVAAGCDGVEFHLSHGYLPWQFLSPLYNKRTDAWGGSYENRLRFPLEALRADAEGDGRRRRSSATGSTRPRSGRAISSSRTSRKIVPDLEAGGRHRLRERLCGRAPRVHPHADGVRARLGEGLRARDPRGLLEAGAARRPDHDARRRRVAAGRRRRRRDLPRTAAVHRSRLGAEGGRGPAGGHPPLRRRELLLEERQPRRPRPVRLQPRARPRAAWGKGTLDARRDREEDAGDRRRAGRARVRADRRSARPRGDRVSSARPRVGGHVRVESLLPSRRSTG